MSEYCYKAGVYWKLEFKKKMSTEELIEIFTKFGCEILYHDEDGDIEFYEDNNKYYPRMTDDGLILEYIFSYMYGDCEGEFAISFDIVNKLTNYVKKLEQDLVIISDPVIFSYCWYTGVDEPFVKPVTLISK